MVILMRAQPMVSVLLAFTVALGLPMATMQADDGGLAGIWIGEARTEGGLGNWIEFRPGGAAQWAFGAVVEGTYRYDGTAVRTTTGVERHETPPIQLRIEGDTAMLQQPAPADAPPREQMSADDRAMFDRMSKPVTMKRAGPLSPGDPPIVGTWQYTHPTGAMAYQTFTRDGNMYLLVLMNAAEGTYASDGARIVVKLQGRKEVLTWTGDKLMSGSLEGRHATFHRAPK